MTNDNKSILDGISANHVETKSLLDTTALGTGRIEATVLRLEAALGRVRTDVTIFSRRSGVLKTKLDRHETRIEALEARA